MNSQSLKDASAKNGLCCVTENKNARNRNRETGREDIDV